MGQQGAHILFLLRGPPRFIHPYASDTAEQHSCVFLVITGPGNLLHLYVVDSPVSHLSFWCLTCKLTFHTICVKCQSSTILHPCKMHQSHVLPWKRFLQ